MFLDGMISQARRDEAYRRPSSRREMLSSRTEFSSERHDRIKPDRPGSSLKMFFARTMSFKSSTNVTNGVRPALSRESSNQLSVSDHQSTRSSSITSGSGSRVTTSSTTESGWSSLSRASWDPPPLFQAYPQALRYALLDSPSASVESILQTKTHKRRTASSLTSAWIRKLYVLVTSGYILQYAADGHHDRLPEKVLQLGHASVAFASDALSGRPYVLQVSRDPDQDDEPMDVNTKSIWSRIGFRSAEEKRMTGSFLLVCESPDELDAWMVTVRREIESHGGAQYRCTTPRAEHDQSQAYQGVQQILEAPASRPGTPQQIPCTISTEYELLPEIRTFSGLWSDQAPFRRSTSTDSSVNTATELDDLRESSPCSSSTATGHRLSLDESHSSLSPAQETFSEKYSALAGSNHDVLPSTPFHMTLNALPAPTPSSPKVVPASHPEQPRPMVCEVDSRPVSGVPNYSLPNLSQRYSRCSVMLSDTSSIALSEVLDIVDLEQSFDKASADDGVSQRPMSTIAPLPSREALVSKQRYRGSSTEHTRPRTSSASMMLAPTLSPMGYRSLADVKVIPLNPAPAYSLFPKRHSSTDFHNILRASTPAEVGDPHKLSVANSTHKRSSSTPSLDESTSLLRVSQPRRLRRPASMQINAKSSLEIENPERSPAVTDLHFATNFGTANPFNRSSSISAEPPTISVPQLELVNLLTQRPGKAARRKTPSLSGIGPPAGPPPTCPLPPPPSTRIRGSSVSAVLSSPRRIFLDLTIDD